MIRRLAPLLIALTAVVALAEARPERFVAAYVTPAGKLVTATLRGSDRVRFTSQKGLVVSHTEVELVGLPDDAEVVDAQAGPHPQESHFLALALRRSESHTYHFVTPAPPREGPKNPFPQLPRFLISDAIFESTGEPYRIISADRPGGDAIEIVFQRGWATSDTRADDPAAKIEQRIYHNGRPGAGLTAGALWDVTSIRAVPR